MSRAYQIRVSESVVRTVHLDDGVQAALELLPLLPRERMAEHLAAELERRGFVRDGQSASRTEPDGVVISVDLLRGHLTVRLGEQHEIAREIQRTVTVIDREAAETVARERVQAELERHVDREIAARQRAVTARLEARIGELRAELDQVTTRVSAAALKERAAQLGEIESIEEGADGSLTIKVKV